MRMDMDEKGRFAVSTDDACRIRLWPLDSASQPFSFQGPPVGCVLHTPHDAGDFLVVIGQETPESDPEYQVWSLAASKPRLLRSFNVAGGGDIGFWLNAEYWVRTGPDQKIRLWRIAAPADAEPLTLLRGEVGRFWYSRFDPSGKWLVSPDESGLAMWPLTRSFPFVIRGHEGRVNGLAFGPDGRWIASSSDDGTIKLWPLEGEAPPPGRAVFESEVWGEMIYGVASSSDGGRLLAGTNAGGTRLLSLGQGPDIPLTDAPEHQMDGSSFPYGDTAISGDGRYAAASSYVDEPVLRRISIWDLASGQQFQVLAEGEARMFANPRFGLDGRITALVESGLRWWDLETNESGLVYSGAYQKYAASTDGTRLLFLEAPTHTDSGRAIFVDLETGTTTSLDAHGDRVQSVALNAAGTVAVTGDRNGVIRIGPVTGEEPHLLLGHENSVDVIVVAPDARRIASGGKDRSLRLWPMPDLSKPPLHTLPREELIAKLKTLTNLRVVRDPESSTGWKLTHDPFPGWETVPTW